MLSPIIEIKTHRTMGTWVKFFEVPSESNPDHAYIVSADAEFQSLGCNCPAWTKHYPRTNCKHIVRLLRERGTVVATGRSFITSDVMPTRTSPEKLERILSRFANVEIE